LDIRFFNTFNHAAQLLDHLLPELNRKGVKARAYISYSRYRSSNRGGDNQNYFEKAAITRISSSWSLMNLFIYALSTSFKILLVPASFHVFFTHPPLYAITGAWLSRLRRIPYGVHIMDHYPGLLASSGILKADGFLYKWFDKKMDKALRGADFVTVLGSCMKELVLSKGVEEYKIKQVINAPTIKDERLTVDYLKSIGLENKFTVIYAGNMGIAHEFRTILAATKKLEHSHPQVHFIMLGKGHRKNEIESYVRENNPENMTLVGYLETDEFTAIMKQTDVHLITLRDNFNGLMVPSKLYSSLALGKPVLFEGPATNEISVVLDKYEAGCRIAHLDEKGLSQKILSYVNDKARLKRHGKNAKKYFEEHCSIDDFVSDYADYLKKRITS